MKQQQARAYSLSVLLQVRLACLREGKALFWAAPEVQAEKDVVLTAISQTGLALEFAGPALQFDREVVRSGRFGVLVPFIDRERGIGMLSARG